MSLSYTVEYQTTTGKPVALVYQTLGRAQGKARLLRLVGRDPQIYRRDANGATLVWTPKTPCPVCRDTACEVNSRACGR